MKAVFIGRFQPFHHGHLSVIQAIQKDKNYPIIGIGSAQYANTMENPFSYEERKEMINRTLSNQSRSSYDIQPITDIHDPPNWVDHVITSISFFDIVYTNNPDTADLFEQHGYPVKQTPLYKRESLSGKHIRNCIMEEKPWQSLVPKEVLGYMKEINGVQRIKDLSK
jgi:nicotinamide-nucleotide adenylyltransferase